jgi:ubiquinone/menaquinone biosynthesis C-methylase UbiE
VIETEARSNAMLQWNTNPCGAVEGSPDELAFFLEVEKARYLQQDWQQEYFRFDKYSGKRVLEIGVGLGTDLAQFAKAGAECHAIDITASHLQLAQRNLALRQFRADIRNADATSIPYPDNYFDAVYSFGVLHHIPDANAVAKEIYRVLKPGGVCLIALYYRWSFFHMYTLLIRGILRGRLFKYGYAGLLSMIERGADGVTIKPYVRLYSKRTMRKLLHQFSIEDLSVRQLYTVRQLYVETLQKSPLSAYLQPITDALAPLIGWYLACTARKP